jgi:thiol-disulfide isomerase/thioredoxin
MEVTMKTKSLVRRIAVAAGLAVAALSFASGKQEPQGAMMQKAPEGAMMAKDAGPSWRVEFTTLDDAKALAAESPTVLFFTADWCPTCKAALRDLDANGVKLGDRKIVLIDYDTSADLKMQYGVTYQHTWVWIDEAGKALATWNGDGVDGILKRVKAM